MKTIAEGECWSQKWSQDRADTESVSEQQLCCESVQVSLLTCMDLKYMLKIMLYSSCKQLYKPFNGQISHDTQSIGFWNLEITEIKFEIKNHLEIKLISKIVHDFSKCWTP